MTTVTSTVLETDRDEDTRHDPYWVPFRADRSRGFRYLTDPRPTKANNFANLELLKRYCHEKQHQAHHQSPDQHQSQTQPLAKDNIGQKDIYNGASPDPRLWSAKIALCALEVIEHRRPLAQLNRWLSPIQYRRLEKQRDRVCHKSSHRLHSNNEASRRLQPIKVISSRCFALARGAYESAVVLYDGTGGRAASVHLEPRDGHWLVTNLKIR